LRTQIEEADNINNNSPNITIPLTNLGLLSYENAAVAAPFEYKRDADATWLSTYKRDADADCILTKASNQSLSFNKLYNTIIYLLPTSSKQLLIENEVVSIPTSFLNSKPLFNYISFFSEISTDLIDEMESTLIKNDHKYLEKSKLLEQEYYKLFITNCKNISVFNWKTELPLYQYPETSTFFSQLHTLSIDKFFISSYYNNNNKQELQELQKYLSIASFPNLLYLKTEYLPRHEVCMLIENSHGNIKNIDIRNDHKFGYTKRLYKSIAINCPKIESLGINIQFKNLGGIKEIFLNCARLNKLELYIVDIEDEEDNCDEILNILADYSSKTFKIFSFNKDFIFSVDGLQNFFEKWRGRIPIKFVTRFYRCRYFTQEHIKIIKKYFDEGVVDAKLSHLYHN
ncbi:15925_t:CDS:2, partial [Rhizophagus irregularis]